ncbi:hypothetical protein BDW68DRAFT_183534 [Aspergillus falconensis]
MSRQKRPAAESPELPTEEEERRLNNGTRAAKKRLAPKGSFNAEIWANSARLESILLQCRQGIRMVSIRNWEGEMGQNVAQQIKAREAHNNSAGSPCSKGRGRAAILGYPGKYLARDMALALVEELGHVYKGLQKGAGCNRGDAESLLEVAAKQVKTWPALKDVDWGRGEDADDEHATDDGEETHDFTNLFESSFGVDAIRAIFEP